MEREKFIERLNEASATVDNEEVCNTLTKSINAAALEIPQNVKGEYNLVICMEELSELQKEISKYIRGKGDKSDLLQEAADVAIVLNYVKVICGLSEEDFNRAINVKIDRMAETLERDGIMR